MGAKALRYAKNGLANMALKTSVIGQQLMAIKAA